MMKTSYATLALMSLALLGMGISSCTPDDSGPRTGTLGSSSGIGGSPSGSSSSNSTSSGAAGNGAGGGMGGSGGGMMPTECTNGMKDGQETDIDCGGPKCLKCVGDACELPTQCASQNCVSAKCAPPSCSDMVKNGTETDMDCGGPDCPDCPDNSNCTVPEDCKSGICNSNLCFPPSCSDGVSNGMESGIDCGGGVCPKCQPGANCKQANDCVSNTCLTNKCVCPPAMITAAAPGNVTYCIDQVEVINKAYVAFVNTPNLPPQDPACSWNGTYVPNGGFPSSAFDGHPVTNVDWCDAYAYCKVQGKHLCGGLGASSVDFNGFADANASIWYNACSGQGASVYPYGSQFNGTNCIDENALAAAPVWDLVQNKPISTPCAGNFPQLYHMSGNVAEWEDSCNGQTGMDDLCRLRGGSYLSAAAEVTCGADDSIARSTTAPHIGFRCCQ